MIVVNLDKIEHSYGTNTVLSAVSWELHAGQKVGMVGPNGAGKSTLLRIISGEIRPDAGFVYRHKEARVGYLAQEPALDPAHTVWQEVLSGAADLVRVEAELRRLEGRMADPEVYHDEAALERVLAAHARIQVEFERLDGYRQESRAREALQALGFAETDFEQPVGVLSGGQKKLVGLAKLLAAGADLLLLDEPDNHLDLAGKTYLERFIAAFPGTVVIVSHDRYLLDETVTCIAEIEDRRLTVYQGNYSAYAVEKQLRLLRQQQMYEAQQKEITRIEAAIARFEYWASIVINERHIRQARSRQKMLDRMERIEKPVLERRRMGLELNGWRGSQKVLEVTGLDKVYPAASGERIVLADGLAGVARRAAGLLGSNGAARACFRCILGWKSRAEAEGSANVQIGFYTQGTRRSIRTRRHREIQVQPMYEQAAGVLGVSFPIAWSAIGSATYRVESGPVAVNKLMLSDANFPADSLPTTSTCRREVLERLDDFEDGPGHLPRPVLFEPGGRSDRRAGGGRADRISRRLHLLWRGKSAPGGL